MVVISYIIIMKDLKDLLKEKERIKELSKHPYFKLLDIVYKRCNTERVTAGYKPMTYGFFAKQLSTFKGNARKYEILKMCQQSSNFAKCFFGMVKYEKYKIKNAKEKEQLQ